MNWSSHKSWGRRWHRHQRSWAARDPSAPVLTAHSRPRTARALLFCCWCQIQAGPTGSSQYRAAECAQGGMRTGRDARREGCCRASRANRHQPSTHPRAINGTIPRHALDSASTAAHTWGWGGALAGRALHLELCRGIQDGSARH